MWLAILFFGLEFALGINLSVRRFVFTIVRSYRGGTVGSIVVRASDGLTYFYIEGSTAANRPTCASASIYWMIRDETSATGQA